MSKQREQKYEFKETLDTLNMMPHDLHEILDYDVSILYEITYTLARKIESLEQELKEHRLFNHD